MSTKKQHLQSKAPNGKAKKKPGSAEGAPAQKRFPIVGIGASAGGLEAFTSLLEELPTDIGMAFVLVQHLDPTHESALPGILARATAMPVQQVTNDLRIEPNHVYVIPPNSELFISNGSLRLRPRSKATGAPHPIDTFLESLAEDAQDCAIGIVLSGTASDGTQGLTAIKAEGGITFAQDKSAKYDSMPRSAIATGSVDFILSPGQIAQELAKIARHPCFSEAGTAKKRGKAPEGDRSAAAPKDEVFQRIFSFLREHRGVDFSYYKPNTFERRISRRMILRKVENFAEYADLLQADPAETDALYADVLIGVTSFFRNPEAFHALKKDVFPSLAEKAGDEPIRLWIAGCSTGQEVYSIAMAFSEFREKTKFASRLQIFATDLSEAALETARAGLYGPGLVADVSAERLQRFFIEEEGGYRIKKGLRESIIFARHNLVTDPPFSRMDIISCRNLMIYLESVLQKQVLPLFHYALRERGFLFLGTSESIGSFTNLFEPVDQKHRIFRRISGPTPPLHRFTPAGRSEAPANQPDVRPQTGGSPWNVEREADRVLVRRFAPPGVLVDSNLRILQFRGSTGAYLEARPGKASLQLLDMAREGLMLPLRAAIDAAGKEGRPVKKRNIRLYRDDEPGTVAIEVVPLKNLKDPCYLILFGEDGNTADPKAAANPAREKSSSVAKAKDEDSRTIGDLETELAETRDYLQSLQEQYESNRDELQSSNEEAHSANEELQSINEELETSKEELESTNEELTTVNEELANRNVALDRLNNDLINLQNSVQTSIVLLGRDLTIRRLNPEAAKRFHLAASDLGRSITTVRFDFDFPDFKKWISGCVENGSSFEEEVQDAEGHWYSFRTLPYRTADNEIDGAVLVLVDIDALKRTEQELRAAHEITQAIVSQVAPLLVLDPDLRIVTANDSFFNHFKVSIADTENRLIFELGNGQWDIPALRKGLNEILPKQGVLKDFEVEHDFENIGRQTLRLNASRLDHTEQIILSIEDITAARKATRSLEDLNQALEDRVIERTGEIQAAMEQLQRLSHDLVHAEYRERQQLASLLHDDIQQILVAAKLHVGLGANTEERTKNVTYVREMLDHALSGTRTLARQLAPPILSEGGLGPALHYLANWAGNHYSLHIKIEVEEGAEAEDLGMRLFLYQNVRELLLNVVKHAGSDRVEVKLTRIEGMLHLTVKDFGRGFDLETIQEKAGEGGSGLVSLRDRLLLMGGRAEVISEAGKGTRIEMIVPALNALHEPVG